MACSLTWQTLMALFSVSNTMKPKPRDLCVSRLNMTSAEITLPYFSKYDRNSAAVERTEQKVSVGEAGTFS
jgi:hypothetical protein